MEASEGNGFQTRPKHILLFPPSPESFTVDLFKEADFKKLIVE